MKRHLTYKALFTATITAAVVVSAVPQAEAVTFKDVDALANAEMRDAIYNLANRGVINGKSPGVFAPNDSITRAEASKIIALALNLDTINVVNPKFSDVKTSDWYYPYVAALANKKIINGYNGKFNPGAPITRGDMAKIIAEAYGLKAKSSNNAHPFKDIPKNHYSNEYVAALFDYNVTTGTSSTVFGYNNPVTRAQLATFTIRAEKATGGGAETPTNVAKTVTLQPSAYGFTSFSAPTTDTSNVYRASLSNGAVQITALNEGQGKILLNGSPTSKTNEFYLVNVEKIGGELKVALEKANVLEYIDYNSNYYSYQDTGISFKPAIATLKKNGQVVNDVLSITLDEKGFDITIFDTGSFTLTLENGRDSKTFNVTVGLKNFSAVIDLQ